MTVLAQLESIANSENNLKGHIARKTFAYVTKVQQGSMPEYQGKLAIKSLLLQNKNHVAKNDLDDLYTTINSLLNSDLTT